MAQQSTEDLPDPSIRDYIWFFGVIYGVMIGMVLFIITGNPDYTLFSKEAAFGFGYVISITTLVILFCRK